MGIVRKGGCKGLPGWFGALFSTFALLTEGGGVPKLFGQCSFRTNTFQKGASQEFQNLTAVQFRGRSAEHRQHRHSGLHPRELRSFDKNDIRSKGLIWTIYNFTDRDTCT